MSKSHPDRNVIAASWRRSEMSGLAPDDRPTPIITDIVSADPLLDAARPVLQRAADELNDTGTALLLVDHDCQLVSRVASGVAVERALDGLGVTTGALFGEDVMGTTALGTPAEIRGGVTVNGSEHYLEQFKSLSCFGRPIVHPATRRLAGIICLTEISPRANPLSVPFVNRLVTGIQDRLLDRSRAEQRAVIDAFGRAAPRRDVAVAAIGDDLQLTNSLAAALLSPADFGTLSMLAAEQPAAEMPMLTLSSGAVVQVVTERIPGVRRAAIFRLRPTGASAPRPVAAAPARPSRTGSSTAITGEPGTGRSRAARAEAGRHLVADVSECLLSGRRLDLAGLVGEARDAEVTLVVDDADMLDEASIHLLRKVIAEPDRAAPPIVVVTGPASAARPSVKALVSMCRSRVDLLPLRQRPGDIVSLAHDLLAEIDQRLDLSAAAADALASAQWPGNLSELSVVVDQAAATTLERAARQVDIEDLPPQYRAITRAARLAGREQAERQAIIEALDAADNNKVHAAKALGVSRTTLYARIRALGIRT
ncbi:putative Fis family transcriptional regulator [Gordonia araii NBRC 100433]|uniref:Putative Fis family transcriptional regulator n=1 Tax=Gordonia araii NBRC 100433 TaxID=1073574 RepID=G7H4P6_9ACTN|nr:helix-turn-helix domain-containing protein [Gordonia araii]NNG98037.1 Fis family transcriptional regulator [Gordonia araii NBRC 100433]GAB10821.1 putative Fis family transcriptional regulator [Gordonia araii NBRC 100433]